MQAQSFLENSRMFPSVSSMLSLYASFSTFLMLFNNIYRQVVPKTLESFLISKLRFLFSRTKSSPSYATFIVDDSWDGLDRNTLIDASRLYLSAKVGRDNKVIRVGKFRGQKNITAALVEGHKIVDVFQGVQLTWKFVKKQKSGDDVSSVGKTQTSSSQKGHFEIVFEEKYREKVFQDYLNHILATYKELTEGDKVLKLFTRSLGGWSSIDFRHPATFDALAMDYEMKQSIIDDLDRFLARKDFYKKIGKAWKRGYLLFGPPGTGKSSLIASMANYLKFDVYDLELGSINSDYDLRKAMLDIKRKSITVIEDIDCHSGVQKRSKSPLLGGKSDGEPSHYAKKFSLSGLLNCIDGLWSSSGEERIIVFTTNRKEVLDPALLRPGRMDMHIHMSYCTPQGFRVLASNYLGIKDHALFEEIEGLVQGVGVTPALVAEELLKSDEVDAALSQLINFLNTKKNEKEKEKVQVADE
ncbi:P-loop containing nucleoside triphosphate hydrolases superfamily protein [Euphorbia peplus]|nr:P-loop containing nucleoside triphosphate hydrolases superfamily protein [Euphorbia peplus]